MKKYTVETLKKENYHFDYEHGITESDVMKVNKIIDAIENSRSTERIQVGDVVQYTNEYGEYFPHAMITNIYDNTEICENGNMYTNIHEGEFCHSTSGGSFSHHEMNGFTYIGKTTNIFWTFGHNGACANGGVYFTATVNLWECNDNKEMFSTKTHDKYYLSHRKSDSDYQYFIENHAWRTEEEMQAWLRTHRAIVTGKTWGGSVIWTYKEVVHHCSNTEYDALNVTEDIFLMNGNKRRCKRVYDDENCILHTYFVWYWEDNSQEFYTRMNNQNKIIDSYKVDYFTNEVNKIALEELRSGKVKPLQIDFER
jgi:hypothetical protein|nr:MAG TPA: protein of unknown function (DUF4121) [Caudoviricetes sp.]